MKYFLYANTPMKPVMRFFNHWYEIKDFLKLMHWDKGWEEAASTVEIFKKLDEEEVKDNK